MGKRSRIVTHFRPGKEQGLARVGDDPITLGIDGSIRINMAKLHPPKNVYDADVAWAVRRHPDFVSLFFAKEDLSNPNTFRTRVEIKYAIEPFFFHFFKNSRDFHTELRTHTVPADHKRPSGNDFMRRTAERDHSEWANFEIIARSGVHASLDFYLLPPAGVARLSMGGGSDWLEATGVLRVYTTTTELRALLDLGEQIGAELEPAMAPLGATQVPVADEAEARL